MDENKRIKKHHSAQKEYFHEDLSIYSDYGQNLNAWRMSYIHRITRDFLKQNYVGKVLIDIGAGSGYVSIEMAKLGINVYACDITPRSIKNLKKYKTQFGLKNLKILQCEAESIPLPAKYIDYIVANAILEHIPEETRAIEEWKRLLKPYGRIFITVPLKFRFIWPFLWPINYIHDRMLGHLRRYGAEELARKFEMKIARVYYTGHLPKVLWLIFSRIAVMGIRKNVIFDDFFEKLDRKMQNIKYGASNVIVVLEKI